MSTGSRTPSTGVDVCIVGAGPAGALVAHRLARAGHDVVILEAGERFDFEDRPTRMEMSLRLGRDSGSVWGVDEERDAFVSSGGVPYPVNLRRARGVGGSTLHWNGRVDRFSRKDFEMETRYGLASDWPIGYEDLRPYYAAAEREFGVSGADDNPFGPPRDEPYPMDPFPPSYSDSLFAEACEELDIETHSISHARNSESYDGRSQCVGYGTCSPVCPSGAKYSADVHAHKAEEEGARIVDRAVVGRLEHDGDRVTGAVYRTPNGETHKQAARQFVLAAGGVENPRLLLLSRSEEHPAGLANSSGAVGRYFMDHPLALVVGELETLTGQNRLGFSTMESYEFYEPERPTPGSFRLSFLNRAGPDVVELALRQREPLHSLRDAVTDPGASTLMEAVDDTRPIQWGDDLLENLRERYGNYFTIMAEIEPLPDPKNRVTLAEDRTDKFGDPVPEIAWSRGDHGERTIKRAFEEMERIVDQIDAETKWTERRRTWHGVGHASGTTRMGIDLNESVVDPDLRAHDVENLHIAGSSTFVTIGATAPTLTIAATALRLADHLDSEVL